MVEILTKDDLQEFGSSLIKELKEFLAQSVSGRKEVLRSEDVRSMLGISTGTLQSLRINGTLSYSKVGGTLYYERADIMKLLQKNKHERQTETRKYSGNEKEVNNGSK